jgi:hypothetical protein
MEHLIKVSGMLGQGHCVGGQGIFMLEYNPAVNVVKVIVVLLFLIRQPAFVKEDVLRYSARFWLWGHLDRDVVQ